MTKHLDIDHPTPGTWDQVHCPVCGGAITFPEEGGGTGCPHVVYSFSYLDDEFPYVANDDRDAAEGTYNKHHESDEPFFELDDDLFVDLTITWSRPFPEDPKAFNVVRVGFAFDRV